MSSVIDYNFSFVAKYGLEWNRIQVYWKINKLIRIREGGRMGKAKVEVGAMRRRGENNNNWLPAEQEDWSGIYSQLPAAFLLFTLHAPVFHAIIPHSDIRCQKCSKGTVYLF